MVSLYIATPCHRPVVDAGYAFSLAMLFAELEKSGVGYLGRIRDGAEISTQRSMLASDFLINGDQTHMLFIDDDISFEASSVTAMVAAQKSMIGCLVPKKKREGGYNSESEIIGTAPKRGTAPIRHIGMGFTLIERAVFRGLVDKNAVRSIDNKTWGFFDCFANPGEPWTAEYSFCRKWRDIGGEIFALVGEKIGHAGRVVYG